LNFLPLHGCALKQTNIAVPATAKQDFKSASAIGGQVKAKKDYRFEIGNLKKTRRGNTRLVTSIVSREAEKLKVKNLTATVYPFTTKKRRSTKNILKIKYKKFTGQARINTDFTDLFLQHKNKGLAN